MKKIRDEMPNITMIEILAIIIGIIIILLIGIKRINTVSYVITYNGINCPTPYVIFYSNGTYEYYKKYGTEEGIKPKKGKYSYDINNIFKNIDKYEENNFGPYVIKVSEDKTYTTYNSNKELMELLSSVDVSLERCMTYKE